MFKLIRAASLVLALLLVAPLCQAADFGFHGFDVRAGVVVPNDWDSGYLIGGSVNIGEITDGLYLFPAITYSQAEDTVGPFDVDVEVTSLAIGAEVRYFPAGSPTAWYFGGGPYLHFLDRELATGRLRIPIESEEIGITGVAGYLLGSDGSGLLLEGRYSVVSGYDTVQILAGYSF